MREHEEAKKQSAGCILAVDDNSDNLALLLELLEPEGYRVLFARDGQAALKVLELEAVQLVLMDVHMPVMEGYEACQRIRQDERLKDLPVLFLSGINETFNKVRAFECGGSDYITKPFNTRELLARVATQLELFASRRTLREQNRKLESLVSELSQTAEALAEARKQAALAELRARLAHELNNPLNYISVGMEALRASLRELAWPAEAVTSGGNAPQPREEISDLLEGMDEGLDRARAIIRRMSLPEPL